MSTGTGGRSACSTSSSTAASYSASFVAEAARRMSGANAERTAAASANRGGGGAMVRSCASACTKLAAGGRSPSAARLSPNRYADAVGVRGAALWCSVVVGGVVVIASSGACGALGGGCSDGRIEAAFGEIEPLAPRTISRRSSHPGRARCRMPGSSTTRGGEPSLRFYPRQPRGRLPRRASCSRAASPTRRTSRSRRRTAHARVPRLPRLLRADGRQPRRQQPAGDVPACRRRRQ